MEAVEAVTISLAKNPRGFGVEAELRRRLVAGVYLEVLRDRVDALAECPQERRVGRLGGQYPPGNSTT